MKYCVEVQSPKLPWMKTEKIFTKQTDAMKYAYEQKESSRFNLVRIILYKEGVVHKT